MTIPTVIIVTPDFIAPNPWQTRQTIDPAGIETLADSIDRDGLLQPILVRSIRRDRYEIIAGQRRLAAWKLLEERGKDMGGIPAIVREIDDRQMLLDTLTENLVREDVDPIEETRAMARALEEIEDLNQLHLAELLGVSKGQVSNRLRLLRLPDSVLEFVTSGRMAWTTARELLALVGDDHIHEDEIAAVIKELPSYKDRVTAKDVRERYRQRMHKEAGQMASNWRISICGTCTTPSARTLPCSTWRHSRSCTPDRCTGCQSGARGRVTLSGRAPARSGRPRSARQKPSRTLKSRRTP